MSTLPPPGEYWKPPPSKEKGDDSEIGILLGVGGALSQWEIIENHFAWLFAIFVESKTHAARRAYGAVQSNSGRRHLLRNASEVFFTMRGVADEMRDQFGALLAHFERAATRRNEIAHGLCMGFQFDNERFGHFLVPADYNSMKTSAFLTDATQEDRFAVLRMNYRYTSADIADFSNRFGELNKAVVEYGAALVKTHPQRQ